MSEEPLRPAKVFNPDQVRATEKIDAATTAAEAILQYERKAREEKTARLRAARKAANERT